MFIEFTFLINKFILYLTHLEHSLAKNIERNVIQILENINLKIEFNIHSCFISNYNWANGCNKGICAWKGWKVLSRCVTSQQKLKLEILKKNIFLSWYILTNEFRVLIYAAFSSVFERKCPYCIRWLNYPVLKI